MIQLCSIADNENNVSWFGGGDIKPKDVINWTVPVLKRVAIDFPYKLQGVSKKPHDVRLWLIGQYQVPSAQGKCLLIVNVALPMKPARS